MSRTINLTSEQLHFVGKTDFTILDVIPDNVEASAVVSELMFEAIDHGFENFCIKEDLFQFIPLEILEERGAYLNFSTVIDFPGGVSKFDHMDTFLAKCGDVITGIYNEMDSLSRINELDIMMPTCNVGEFPFSASDLAEEMPFSNMDLKLIIETNIRTDDEICEFMQDVGKSNLMSPGVFYVKTGSGKFGKFNVDTVRMMSDHASFLSKMYDYRVPIKVSGGIESAEEASELLATRWVKRLGISGLKALNIVEDLR